MDYESMINFSKIQDLMTEIFGGGGFSQAKNVSNAKFYTITDLLPYRYYDETKEVFINKGSIGFILESSLLVGADEGVIDSLQGIFSDAIPKGCTVQFINFASPKIANIIDQWRSSRRKVGGVYNKLAQKRAQFLSSAGGKSLFSSTPYTLKNFRLLISVSLPLKSAMKESRGGEAINSKIDNICSFREGFVRSLETAGIKSQNVNPDSLINFLDEVVNFDFNNAKESTKYDPKIPINKQVVSPQNSLKVDQDEIFLFACDEKRKVAVRSFSVRNLPSSWAQWQSKELIGSTSEDLRRMEYPFITNFCVTLPMDEESLIAKAKRKNFNATRTADSEMSKFLPEMRTQAKEWQFVNDKITSGQRLLKSFYQIVVFAPSCKINEAESSIKSIYKTNGWDIVRDRYINLQSFLASMPFTHSEGLFQDLENLNRNKTMVSWTCANLLPLQGEWQGMDSPCVMLSGRRGQPFFWNPFKNQDGNYNVAVIGKSGSGKSVFMQELVSSILGIGGKVYVIDDGRSFMNSCLLQKGEFVEFSDKSKICLNPFSVVSEEDMLKNPEYKSEVIKLIKSIVRQMCEGEKREGAINEITQIQDRYIEEAVQKVWDSCGSSASVSKVEKYFLEHKDERARDLSILIRPFCKGGIYGRFFEGKSNIKINNAFMVFELAELKNKKEFQAIVLMFLMFLVSENMYFGDRKTPISLLIDEAWDLLHGEGSKAFIEGLARRARKYCGNIITGTQSVNDYYKNSATLAAFENTDWVVLLSQKSESIEQLAKSKKIVMDEALKSSLKSLRMVDNQYSELLIYGPRGYAIGRLVLDPYSKALYSSKAQDFAKIQELTSSGLCLEDAIEELSELNSSESKVRIFDRHDYKKILHLIDNERLSFEDALEEVFKNTISTKFPAISKNIYKS